MIEVVPGSEQREAIPDSEKDNGEGHISRTATMKVTQVLWSNPEAEPAPQSFEVELPGWWWDKNGEREFAWKGQPRYEEGHKYIALLVKEDGAWNTTLNAMPYDNDTVGTGELGGAIAKMSTSQGPLAEEAHGKNAAAVKELLSEADRAR
ncbi:hypothetical protein [Streptomyces graminofaciens]|uniref:hypothetical protein n=1 Tax=Streptomyces graminofaciens TaxID=68212 RepID=UPI0025739687|nr:hypothetical protein [Streptomyces graminofaciens]